MYAGRALSLWSDPGPRGLLGDALVHSLVWAEGQPGPDVGSNRRRVASLRRWLDASDDPTWQTMLYRDMAQYAADARDTEAALDAIGKATVLAERSDEPRDPARARHIHVHVLLLAKRPADALPLLPGDDSDDVNQRLLDLCQRCEVLQALSEWSEAQASLDRAYALCREHFLPTEYPDVLAHQM